MTSNALAARIDAIVEVPLNRHLGLVFDEHADGGAVGHFDAAEPHSAFGGLHGGVFYALLDAICMLALLPALSESEHAVTHDLHVSMMRPVAPGTRCVLEGRLIRKGRTLAFLEGVARADGQVIASARVTKSILAGTRPSAGKTVG
jgi:uncharacterized protein (TIGR00369 family)